MAAAIPPHDEYRLVRMLAMVKSAFLVGFAIGAYRGGRRASLQFMAETRHSLAGIRTRQEAAAYWKLRHARTIVGAAKEGTWRATQLATVAAVFVAVRQLVEHLTWWVAEREGGLTKTSNDSDGDHWTMLDLSELMTKSHPYVGQVVAAAATGSLVGLVAPNSQRLRYGLRGTAMGGAMALSLALFQHLLSSRDTMGHQETTV